LPLSRPGSFVAALAAIDRNDGLRAPSLPGVAFKPGGGKTLDENVAAGEIPRN